MSETGRVMKRRNPYMVVDVTPFRDTRLSWKAKGLMTYFLDKPEGWTFMLEHIFKQAPDGKASVRSGLKELQKHGYLVRVAHRDGKIIDRWEWLVYEEPVHSPTDKPIHVNSTEWKQHLENGGTIDVTLFITETLKTLGRRLLTEKRKVEKPLEKRLLTDYQDVDNQDLDNRTLVINKSSKELKDSNNLEQQLEKPEKKNEVVVSLDQSFLILDKWETLFDESLSTKKITTLSKLAIEGMKAKQINIHNPSEKDVVDRITHVMENMKVHSFPFKTNAVKAISDALENGYTWTTEKKQAKPRKRVSAEKIPSALVNQLEQGQKEVAATVVQNDDWQSKLEEWNKQKRSNQ